MTSISTGSSGNHSARSAPLLSLPDFKNPGNILVVIVIAQLLAIILATAHPGSFDDKLRYLAVISLFIQWVAITDVALLRWCAPWLTSISLPLAAWLALVGLQVVTAAYTGAAYGVALITGLAFELAPNWLRETILSNVLVSSIICAVALRYFYIQAQWQRNIQAEAQARVIALQARIRPHFLFNSMNTIASLTRADPMKAEQAVEDLADLFRASLADKHSLTLSEEIDLIRAYLRIETLRLGSRLTVNWQLEQPLPPINLPALTLQPLVENAIYHGIEHLPEGGAIQISVTSTSTEATVQISNPVCLQKSDETMGHQMAQDNVRQRLELAFSGAAKMRIEATPENYRVMLMFPRES